MARKGMEEYIREVDFLELAGQFDNPLLAAPFMASHTTDLLFLDIQMPKQTGIDFLKSQPDLPMAIITTAYPEYALEGYALDVMDYLLKPIAFPRFLKAVNKARDFYLLKNSPQHLPVPAGYFFVKADGKYEKILFEELRMVEALQNYVALYTGQRKMLSYITLSGIEKQLPASQFIKVHKSYIVSVGKIRSVEGNMLQLTDGRQVPISRNLREEVMKRVVGERLVRR